MKRNMLATVLTEFRVNAQIYHQMFNLINHCFFQFPKFFGVTQIITIIPYRENGLVQKF